MKVICFAFGLALLLVGIADFFSSPASAAPRGSMSGSDMTYGKTGQCQAGDCNNKKPSGVTRTTKQPKGQ